MHEFDTLVYRKDLDGHKIIAIMQYRNSLTIFHRFDVSTDHENHIRGKTKEIYKALALI
jgi:hypothetical protein